MNQQGRDVDELRAEIHVELLGLVQVLEICPGDFAMGMSAISTSFLRTRLSKKVKSLQNGTGEYPVRRSLGLFI